MLKKFLYFLRGFFFLTVLLAVVISVILYRRVNDEVSRQVQMTLSEMIPDFGIEFESARFADMQGIRIKNFRLGHSGDTASGKTRSPAFFEAEEIFIEAPLSLSMLTEHRIIPQRIVLTRPQLYYNASQDNDYLESLKELLANNNDLEKCPIEIRDATLIITSNEEDTQEKGFRFSGLQISVTPPPAVKKSDNENRSSSPEKQSRSTPTPVNTISNYWTVQLDAANPYVKNLSLFARVTSDFSQWSLNGKYQNFGIGPDILKQLPDLLKQSKLPPKADQTGSFPQLSVQTIRSSYAESETEVKPDQQDNIRATCLKTFQGQTTGNFSMGSDPQSPLGFRFQVNGEIFRGTIVFPILKYPVTEIFIQYHVTDETVQIKRLTARSGPVLILASYQQDDLILSPQNATFQAQLESFPLDSEVLHEFYPLFPPEAQNIFNDYQFSMTAKLNLLFQCEQGEWKPSQITLDCQNLDLLYKKFPYKMERLSGQLSLDQNEQLRFHFASSHEEENIQIEG
ncbi:MAG: hypothetical protein IKW74_02145, partial [Thermoguttaceae bacterium]|nr:hypothetical protein [Thermoguttaceae bacterium]